MSQTFQCPSCGAPLEPPSGSETTMRCPFCSSSVIVPETLREGGRSSVLGADLSSGSAVVWAEIEPQIRRLLQQGQKIEAIKIFRAAYSADLLTAKNAVEAVERGEAVPPPAAFQSIQNLPDLQNLKEIGRLVRANQKIDAIKLYRQSFGVGLKEAKDAVDALERGEPLQISSTTSSFSSQSAAQFYANSAPVVEAVTPRKSSSAAVIVLLLVVMVFLGLGLLVLITFNASMSQTVDSVNAIGQAIQPDVATAKAQVLAVNKTTPTPSNASLLLSFGEKGMGPGQFQDARSIAVDPQGNIYLAEYQGGRVLVFDAAGKFLTVWNTGEKKAALLSLAVDRSSAVSIVLGGDLLRFKGLTGEALGRIKNGGTGSTVEYAQITADGGTLMIAAGEDVYLTDAQGKQKLSIPHAVSKISEDSELDTHAAIDGLGNIYLLGHFNNAVFKYSSQGKYLSRFGGEGDKPGLFRAPEDVTVDGLGRVYVSDISGVQVFDSTGRYLSTIKVEGAAFGLTVDDQNNLYVITNKPQVYKFKVSVTP